MDILGVSIVMIVCSLVLGKGEDEVILILPEQDVVASSPLFDNTDVSISFVTSEVVDPISNP